MSATAIAEIAELDLEQSIQCEAFLNAIQDRCPNSAKYRVKYTCPTCGDKFVFFCEDCLAFMLVGAAECTTCDGVLTFKGMS